MAKKSLNGALQHVRRVAAVHTYRGLADAELLERFVALNEEAAFALLIERHGPMVLGVCRRALGNLHDAEDGCQAAFLVLARRAGSIRKSTALAGWLHGVACRVAARIKRNQARRRRRERNSAAPLPQDRGDDVTWREMQTILDEELEQLPERFRTPLILCYLDGKTRDEAAQQLGLSAGSLHGRLERGRTLLRARLTQRGLTLSAALCATVLGTSAVHAALPATFVVSCAKAALVLAGGQPLPMGVIPAGVLTLTQEVLRSMFVTKLKLGTATLLCACLVVAIACGSWASIGVAQDTPRYPAATALLVAAQKAESDADFIRRVSKDLRGHEPTPTEIHFFVASNDAGKRQKLIDLLIQERQAKKTIQDRITTYHLVMQQARTERVTSKIIQPDPKKKLSELDPTKVWKEVFAKGGVDAAMVIATADHLFEAGQYRHAAEFLKANLSAGVVVRPWVYEALAVALEADGGDADEIRQARRNAVSDAELMRRIWLDQFGKLPSPDDIAQFKNADPARVTNLIDKLLESRTSAKQWTQHWRAMQHWRAIMAAQQPRPAGLVSLQQEFIKELLTSREKGDTAKITSSYLDRLLQFVKDNPKDRDVADAMWQIVMVYEAQGNTVEANAWRDKLKKEHPKQDEGR